MYLLINAWKKKKENDNKSFLFGGFMEDLENKYIILLLEKCLNFKKSKSLFISFDKVNKDFVDKIIKKAENMGIIDIYLDMEDINVTHDKLKNSSIKEIEKDSYFDKSIWNTYALKNASFLMLETEFPGMFDDIEEEKIAISKKINQNTRKEFRKKESTYEIPWCIAALPNEIWANSIFKNDPKSYEKLFNIICKMCMVDTKNPIESWNNYLKKVDNVATKLNDLKIESMTYKNSLGTNLTVKMPKNHIWNSAAGDNNLDMFVNMPSYEIFSSPSYLETEGIVYSSKPLIYGGGKVDDFYLEFKNGKVVNYDAKKGKEILKSIIESDNNACYLGEVALVNDDSPISNTNLVFGTTLFDENASCHLALGDGFSECLKNTKMTKDELLKCGINQSVTHVDFMIGTSDLEIEAITKNGKEYIFKNGNFCI